MQDSAFTVLLRQVRDTFIAEGEHANAAAINNGECADYATVVLETYGWERWPAVHILSDTDMGTEEYSHTFLEYGGLYYDAECTEGVDDWTQLPCFHRFFPEGLDFLVGAGMIE